MTEELTPAVLKELIAAQKQAIIEQNKVIRKQELFIGMLKDSRKKMTCLTVVQTVLLLLLLIAILVK